MRSLKFLFTLLSFCFVSICFGQVVSNGDSFSVTVPVSNNGPATEYAAKVEFTIPEGAQYVSSNPTIGSYSESDSTWYIGLISSGRSQSIKVNFEVTDLSQYPLVISASASGVANDADLTNNNFTDTIFKLTDILSGSAQSWGNASLRGTVLDNDSLCNSCSTKTYLVGGSTNNGTVVYFDELSGEYRFVFENPNEDASFSYDLVCYDCGDGVEHYQNTSVEVIPKLFTDSLFGGSSGTVYPDTFAQEVIVEEIDTTTKKIKIVMNTGDTLEAMFTDYRGTAGSGDDWGAQSVQSDSTLSGDGTAGSPLTVNYLWKDSSSTNEIQNWEGQATDSFVDVTDSVVLLPSPNIGVELGIESGSYKTFISAGSGLEITRPDTTNRPNHFEVSNTAEFPGFTDLETDYGVDLDTFLTSVDTDSTLTGDGTAASPLSVNYLWKDSSDVNEVQGLSVNSTASSVTSSLNALRGVGGGTQTFEQGTGINLSTTSNLTTVINTAPFPGFTDLETDYGVDTLDLKSIVNLIGTSGRDTAQHISGDTTLIPLDLGEIVAINPVTDTTGTDPTKKTRRYRFFQKLSVDTTDYIELGPFSVYESIKPDSLYTFNDSLFYRGYASEADEYFIIGMDFSQLPFVTETEFTDSINALQSEIDINTYVMDATLVPNTDTISSTVFSEYKMAIPMDAVVSSWVVNIDYIETTALSPNTLVTMRNETPNGASVDNVSLAEENNGDFETQLNLTGSGYPVQAGGTLSFSIELRDERVSGVHVSVVLKADGSETNVKDVINYYSPPPP